MKRRLKLMASLAVTVVFSWWAFRDTHWDEQWASLTCGQLRLGAAVPARSSLLIHLCRTLRWGALLAGAWSGCRSAR